MIYDQVNFDISIEGTVVRYERGKDKIKLNMLSSGEKQIVSLFSHIYFSSVPRRFVIIDEPELSLSVTWQQRLLPDLLRTDRCQGLIAVTHSPFIYDNELDPYTRGIDEFTCIL